MFDRPLSSFVPAFYKGVVEMEDIIGAEQIEMDIARREMTAAFANTFVLTADEVGILMFENMLNIAANTYTEDLEFRRQRVLNRLSMSPPFTYRFLKQKLDQIIGVGAWTAYIDFENYTLYVESSATNQNWYHEVEFTINRIKPCNMVFINVPRTSVTLSIGEEISHKKVTFMYRLGSWRLGEYPFLIYQEGGIIKMSNNKSVQQALLNDTANFVSAEISHVLLNDTILISEFDVKQVSENILTIEYKVTPNMVDIITDIKLIKADNTVLTRSAVYVPITQPVINKHTITVKEGE